MPTCAKSSLVESDDRDPPVPSPKASSKSRRRPCSRSTAVRRRGPSTNYNALGNDFYLRIADELYLKRLIVGGYERVFEIAKDFRNEGMDRTHSPEFTMLEWYEAYSDYLIVLERLEQLFQHIAGRP